MARIESPCINVCILDPRSVHCLGCGRSLDEIAGWTSYSDGQRARVIADLPRRLVDLRLGTHSATGAAVE